MPLSEKATHVLHGQARRGGGSVPEKHKPRRPSLAFLGCHAFLGRRVPSLPTGKGEGNPPRVQYGNTEHGVKGCGAQGCPEESGHQHPCPVPELRTQIRRLHTREPWQATLTQATGVQADILGPQSTGTRPVHYLLQALSRPLSPSFSTRGSVAASSDSDSDSEKSSWGPLLVNL